VCSKGELPPAIIVGDLAQSYMAHDKLLRTTDVLLARPLTSSALFNAVNAIVSKQPDSLDRVLQCTNFDELRAQWLAGVRILVVDDSDINLEVAQRILEKQGATVTTCSDGLAALEHVRAHHQLLDVVLMDVQMPIVDGNEATRRIREELKLTMLPIVALTAGALVVERQRALEAGMNDFISKPFDPQALIRKVRQLVEKARGEPISMVILDAQSTREADSRPKLMASIDAGIVQQMFGEDLLLFKSLLLRLLQEYTDFTVPIRVSPEDQVMHARLMGRAHKLKGSAGMIGATEIARLAGATEKALHQGRSVDVVEGLLARLASVLTTLREEAATYLKRRAESDTADLKAGSGSEADTAQLDELCALLEAQDLAALEKFRSLSRSLSELLGALRFERVRDAVENLDFRQGLQLLCEARLKETQASPPMPSEIHP
jgi:CheY-like chemotaxis protein